MVKFQKDKFRDLLTLINLKSEVNAMLPAYTKKLGLEIWKTNVSTQKIDELTLKIFRMVIASFEVEDKFEKAYFFQKTFLMANSSMEVILEMLFFSFSNADIFFIDKELFLRTPPQIRHHQLQSKYKSLIG